MVQAKKEEVKREVENAALKIFSQKSYLDTKMSDIAKEANVSVGNIYTYFKNKEDLFYSVVPERLMIFLKEYLVESVHTYNKNYLNNKQNKDYDFLTEDHINMVIKYRMQLLIIFEKSKGTRYENAKEDLINSIVVAKRTYLRKDHKRYNLCVEESVRLMKIIINSLINMVLDVLKEDMSEESRITIFKALNIYRLYGINGLNE